MNVLFLDTSALLAIATDTAGRDAVLTAFDCADVVAASGLALTEALALDRLTDERYARVDLNAVRLTWDYLHIVPLDARCTERAATLARERPLRPLSDAIHFAAAERLPLNLTYATLDPNQIPTALDLGYEVLST